MIHLVSHLVTHPVSSRLRTSTSAMSSGAGKGFPLTMSQDRGRYQLAYKVKATPRTTSDTLHHVAGQPLQPSLPLPSLTKSGFEPVFICCEGLRLVVVCFVLLLYHVASSGSRLHSVKES